MNGWEFLREFEIINGSLLKSVEIFLVTSSVDLNDREEAGKQKHVADFFNKPLKPEQLLQLIQGVLAKRL
jgi:CheY-like chemotaxis protein